MSWHMIFFLVVCGIRKVVVLVEANFSASNLLAHFIDLLLLTWRPLSEFVDFMHGLPFLTSFNLQKHNTERVEKIGHWWGLLAFSVLSSLLLAGNCSSLEPLLFPDSPAHLLWTSLAFRTAIILSVLHVAFWFSKSSTEGSYQNIFQPHFILL